MVSWLPPGSWLGPQEACPQWPCLNLPTAAWQEAVRSRRLALASPSDAQAVGSPRVWLDFPAPALGSRVQMWLPPSQRLWAWPLLTSQGLSLCTCFCPRGWGLRGCTVWGRLGSRLPLSLE